MHARGKLTQPRWLGCTLSPCFATGVLRRVSHYEGSDGVNYNGFVERKFRYDVYSYFYILRVAPALPRLTHSEGGPGDLWQTFTVNDALAQAAFLRYFGTRWCSGLARRQAPADTTGGGAPSVSGWLAAGPGAIAQANDGALWFGAAAVWDVQATAACA
jgi:hypothetical protein